MNSTFTIELRDRILIVRFTGSISMDDLKEAIDAVAGHSQNFIRLWDLSPGIDFPNQDLKELADYVRKKLDFPSRVAIVAAQDLTYGLMRMFEVYREREDLKFKVFREEAAAVAWLTGAASG